ncbi:conserved hypothetical protein [Trichinella spiralis]|uniref:hypothetical protein n=1 Tax=Trichinella spiralis TaxID=6334 RepID=UPI0001EFE402|nr:conserved hypothetical protein [Trichinella spiralis]
MTTQFNYIMDLQQYSGGVLHVHTSVRCQLFDCAGLSISTPQHSKPSSSSLTDESDCGLDEELRKRLRLRPDSSGSEADTISDESGYIDEDDRPDAVVVPSKPLRAIESTAL